MSKVLDEIKRAIRDSEMSRYRMARESGVSEAALCRLLNGERGMGIEAIEKVADALELEVIIRPKSKRRRTKNKGR